MLSVDEEEVADTSAQVVTPSESSAIETLIAAVSQSFAGQIEHENHGNKEKKQKKSSATIDASATDKLTKLLKDKTQGSVVPFEFFIAGHGPVTLEIRIIDDNQIQVIDFFHASIEDAKEGIAERDIRALMFRCIREIVPDQTSVLDEHGHIV